MAVLRIEYVVAPDPTALAEVAAREFVEAAEAAVRRRGRARIAISGGATPKAVFELLADPRHPWLRRMPWQQIDLYWVDERCVPPDAAESNYRMTRETLLDPLAAEGVIIDPERVHRMEGELEPQVAAARYESLLRNTFRLEGAEIPRFDIVALGMGEDGHTASIFPHTEAVDDRTNLVTANRSPQAGDISQASGSSQGDSWRITLTWPVLNQGSHVFFVIGGVGKAAVVRDVFGGPYDVHKLPSQLIWPAGGILTVILDQAAASMLPPTGAEGRGQIERKR